MPAFLYAKNQKGEIAQIVISSHAERSRTNVAIVENYRDTIETDDYKILENYTDYGCIDNDINELLKHIVYLHDYISFVNKKFDTFQHVKDPEFQRYKWIAQNGRNGQDYICQRILGKIKNYIERQDLYIKANSAHRKKARLIKWVGGLMVGAIIALCICIAFCQYAGTKDSRYVKSGSFLIDTKLNCVLDRSNGEWIWAPINTGEGNKATDIQQKKGWDIKKARQKLEDARANSRD